MPAAAEAQTLHQAGRLREAARLYEQALKRAPDDAAMVGRQRAGLSPAAIDIPA